MSFAALVLETNGISTTGKQAQTTRQTSVTQVIHSDIKCTIIQGKILSNHNWARLLLLTSCPKASYLKWHPCAAVLNTENAWNSDKKGNHLRAKPQTTGNTHWSENPVIFF
jgi:hypothetical protein